MDLKHYHKRSFILAANPQEGQAICRALRCDPAAPEGRIQIILHPYILASESQSPGQCGQHREDYNSVLDAIEIADREVYLDYLHRASGMLKGEIMAWNRQDIDYLVALLQKHDDIAERLESRTEDMIDLSSLPTEEIPAGLETYPVWALDVSGRALVGADAGDVESLGEIREGLRAG